MSLYNPLEHPDILPVILSFCEDRTLARLMRCSRSLLAAIVTARYPHVQVDPGASTLQQPNTIRTDLPTDARWFSPAFTAYIARFARVVSVRPHARWRCPPKGLMLGLGDEEGISGTARHSGHGEAECMALPGHESGDGGLPESVHVNALRVDMQGVCRPSTSVSHFHSDLPKSLDQSPCATLSFFRPDTMIITAFLYQNHLQAALSLSISRHTRRLVIELDITKNYETTHQRGVAVSLIPDCVLLAGMIPEGVEEVVVFVLPNAVFMKRNEGIRYAVFGSALAEFVVGSSEELTGQVGQNQGDEDDPDDIVVDEAGSDHADKGRRLGRTYTFVNLGQLNPSWAHKKVWDEYHLQTIVLSDILHNVASATSGAPPSPDTLSGITCHQYLSSRAGRSETPHNLLLERWHAASRQSHAIMAANRKAAEREKEREKAAAGMKGSMGGQVGVEGEEGNHGIGEMGGAVGVGVGGGGGAHGTTGGW